MFSVTDEMEAEGDALYNFLSSCFKKRDHVTEVKAKLDDEGIDYEGLFGLSEKYLCETLEELEIRKYRIGLIVKKLKEIPKSGVNEYPLNTSQYIPITTEQNEYILKLQKEADIAKQNMKKLAQTTEDINKNAKMVELEVNKYYKSLNNLLAQKQAATLQKLEMIKNKKLNVIKQTYNTANESVQHLEKTTADFNVILNDGKLDITKKQIAITQHIDASKAGLEKYKMYLDKDMPLPTGAKLKYEAKEQELFRNFVNDMDNIIDCDIHFTEIKFDDYKLNIAWKCDLQNKTECALQCKGVDENNNDDEKKSEREWDVLTQLKMNQTSIDLSKLSDDEKEDDKMMKGKIGLLKELTSYQFRIVVTAVSHKMYSAILRATTPQFVKGLERCSIITKPESIQLMKWIENSDQRTFTLLLRGSVDGFAASTFHSKCDNKGKTLVIVRSEKDHVFGGYTEQSWSHIGNYKRDDKAWIFLLRSAIGDKSKKWMPTKNPQYAIYAINSQGPTFGGGHDLYLANGCNNNKSSYSGLGSTYSVEASQTKLAGEYYFKVIDYEVWQIS